MAKKLTQREKYSIYAVSGTVCLFIIMQLVVFPMFDKRKRLRKTLRVETKLLQEMMALKSEHDALMRRAGVSEVQFKNREKGFTLFSFLDKLSGKAAIKDRITYMKPSTVEQKNSPYKTSRVEMKFRGLTLKQLTSYLHMVETSKNMVRIKRLSISKDGKREGFIDAVIQVETSEI
jgi:general secretion pathway protein M